MTDHPRETPRLISGRHLVDGTFWAFLAEALMAPTMLITAAYLSRKIGAEGYGLLTVTLVTVAWAEWSISAIFARATIKFVSENEDWEPIATTVVRWHLGFGLAAMFALMLMSPLLAELFGEATLRRYLIIAAIDIPIFTMAHAHRHILIGLGRFRGRAFGAGMRWIVRLCLVIVLVEAGFSIEGAILANVGASVAELTITRFYVRVPFFGGRPFPLTTMLGYIAPLSLFALSTRFFDKLDLFMLKSLGASAAEAGYYGAAQNLALLPSIFSVAFGLPLLTALSRHAAAGDQPGFRQLSTHAIRAVLALLILGGIIAASSREIIQLVYGEEFVPAAPILALLMFAAITGIALAFLTAMLTAAGRPRWCLGLGLVMVPTALLSHYLIIPRAGMTGAACVTLSVSGCTACAAGVLVHRLTGTPWPWMTLGRCLAVAAAAGFAGYQWQAEGLMLLAELGLGVLLAGVLLMVLRELKPEELSTMRLWLKPTSAPENKGP